MLIYSSYIDWTWYLKIPVKFTKVLIRSSVVIKFEKHLGACKFEQTETPLYLSYQKKHIEKKKNHRWRCLTHPSLFWYDSDRGLYVGFSATYPSLIPVPDDHVLCFQLNLYLFVTCVVQLTLVGHVWMRSVLFMNIKPQQSPLLIDA